MANPIIHPLYVYSYFGKCICYEDVFHNKFIPIRSLSKKHNAVRDIKTHLNTLQVYSCIERNPTECIQYTKKAVTFLKNSRSKRVNNIGYIEKLVESTDIVQHTMGGEPPIEYFPQKGIDVIDEIPEEKELTIDEREYALSKLSGMDDDCMNEMQEYLDHFIIISSIWPDMEKRHVLKKTGFAKSIILQGKINTNALNMLTGNGVPLSERNICIKITEYEEGLSEINRLIYLYQEHSCDNDFPHVYGSTVKTFGKNSKKFVAFAMTLYQMDLCEYTMSGNLNTHQLLMPVYFAAVKAFNIAHMTNVFHCDFKSKNIYLNLGDHGEINCEGVILGDWGLSVYLNKKRQNTLNGPEVIGSEIFLPQQITANPYHYDVNVLMTYQIAMTMVEQIKYQAMEDVVKLIHMDFDFEEKRNKMYRLLFGNKIDSYHTAIVDLITSSLLGYNSMDAVLTSSVWRPMFEGYFGNRILTVYEKLISLTFLRKMIKDLLS